MAIAFTLNCGTSEKINEKINSPKSQKGEPAPGKLVKVYPVQLRRMEERLELHGTVEPESLANILSTSEGKISKLLVREGDMVQQNQVVGYISSFLREDIINSARLLVEMQRKKSAQDLNDLQLKKALEQAEDDYRFALRQYREIPIVSPISGAISKRWADVGDMLSAKARLFEIQSSSRFKVIVQVSELDIVKLKIGRAAEIYADSYPDKRFKGIIHRIYPQVDVQTRNGTLEINLIDSPPNLKAGMFVRITFITRTLEEIIAIPIQAIINRPQHNTCFIENKGKAEERIVQTGLEANGWVHVISGLSTGDNVVIEGQQELKTGTPVKLQGEKTLRPQVGDGNK
jgi:RND family efflux transporter MFP subunit